MFTRFALEKYATGLGLTVDAIEPRGAFWSVIGRKLLSHLALRVARMGGDIQKVGALTYEPAIQERPRYWALPVLAPGMVAIATTARALDALDPDDSETLGYLLIATKRGS
jgi:hypothetical protein